MSKNKAPWLVPFLAGALVLIVLVWGFLRSGPSSVQVGGRAPNFTLSLLDGGELRLKELRGQVVVLNSGPVSVAPAAWKRRRWSRCGRTIGVRWPSWGSPTMRSRSGHEPLCSAMG